MLFARLASTTLLASVFILALSLSFGAPRTWAAIGNVVQRGNVIFVYDEKGKQLFTKPAGSGKDDGLKGYTSGTVNIRRGSVIYTYDDKGRQVFTKPAGR
ncbi:MAG: hypothetical protein LBQ10_09130 [Desulfovibrio sp.]|jgi:hypothetical protein|nr:hypothetical protein [Desulfovibrio sp.]